MRDKLNKYAELIGKIFGTQRVYNNQSILDYLQGDMFKDGLRRGLYEEVNKVINSQSEDDIDKYKGCFICGNGCKTSRKDVPFWINNLDNKIMIIAEEPGAKPNIGLATPFAADKFLTPEGSNLPEYEYLCSEEGLGLNVEDLYITDALKCFCSKNKQCINYCVEHLKKEIYIIRPDKILIMGGLALESLKVMNNIKIIHNSEELNLNDWCVSKGKKNQISQLHGEFAHCRIYFDKEFFDTRILFMLHPSPMSGKYWKKVVNEITGNFKSIKEELRRLGDIIRNAMK